MARQQHCRDCGNPDCPNVSTDPYWSRCPAAMRPTEIDCPVCGKLTTFRTSGLSHYISTHLVVIDGSPETCGGSRNPISDRAARIDR